MTIVVKIGGSNGVATANIVCEIAQCVADGQRIVVLHGGSDLTNTLSERLDHPVRMITSPGGMVSRYTDSETLSIYAMAVAGQINTDLVASLQRQGVNALGLAGVDGRLLLARRKSAIRSVTPDGRVQILRDDYTGQIEQVNDALLRQLLDVGYTPVIAPLALSMDGERLNVDGDRAASAVAAALHADALVIMTNVPGLLANPEDQASVISTIPTDQLADYVQYAHGRMRKKLLGAQEALQNGVPRVCIGSNSFLAVLDGAGTVIESVPTHVERTFT
jgi:[amino group carrier protein]-L-2-aminoadipate 6-kinase